MRQISAALEASEVDFHHVAYHSNSRSSTRPEASTFATYVEHLARTSAGSIAQPSQTASITQPEAGYSATWNEANATSSIGVYHQRLYTCTTK
jgi:hypothetical protein